MVTNCDCNIYVDNINSMKKLTPDIIHKVAEKMSTKNNNDAKHMRWAEQITGKRHLDNMTNEELMKIYVLLLTKKYPKDFTNEDDMYLHRAIDQYISPEKTEKLKQVLSRVYSRKQRKEEPKYAWLSSLANKVRDRISIKNGDTA